MRRFHLAISTNNITASVADYSQRLGAEPVLVVPEEYALWRTERLNVSIRQDPNCKPGEVRHVGWEDDRAESFSAERDVNGLLWERFSPTAQVAEIKSLWPSANISDEA